MKKSILIMIALIAITIPGNVSAKVCERVEKTHPAASRAAVFYSDGTVGLECPIVNVTIPNFADVSVSVDGVHSGYSKGSKKIELKKDGTYTVAPWNKADYYKPTFSPGCNGPIRYGETKSCTITYEDTRLTQAPATPTTIKTAGADAQKIAQLEARISALEGRVGAVERMFGAVQSSLANLIIAIVDLLQSKGL